MKIRTLVLGAVVSAGALAAASAPASAYVACNRFGDCWHTGYRDFRPGFGIRIHDNSWRWRHRDHYRWREHDGRGYWGRNGVWITF
jgi:hypothetical protein